MGRIKRKTILFVIIIFILSFGIVKATDFALHKSSETEFCISCHSMTIPYNDYIKSPHYANQHGVSAQCKDCHINEKSNIEYLTAKLGGIKDIWFETTGKIDSKEKYEEHRMEMAQTVWKQMEANNSATCRSCHDYDKMNFDKMSAKAKQQMQIAASKNQSCIDCHKGIAHSLPKVKSDTFDINELKSGSTAYTTTISPLYNDQDFASIKAKILPYTQFTVLDKAHNATKIKLTGWQEAHKNLLYAMEGKRITDAVIRGLNDIQETGKTYYNHTTKKSWKELSIIAWIKSTPVTTNINQQWEKNKFEYESKCAQCHQKVQEHHFSSNDWPAQFKGMARQAKLTKNETQGILKYLQYHSSDITNNVEN
ncbi:NapC/NirT family cytochrome c [Photobacterium leiognathi]|uniref:NapC/NirT family cytochrome c n=1 Tax=Photobacterium leiognathi TaxID=553611 RepID=UPI002981ACD6|nr:NapC/NirT family cytochrome c [Photobacterium leiognathi]